MSGSSGSADFFVARAALEFLRDWALPHFYFHIVTAYGILRHEGMQIAKRDYIAHAGSHMGAG